MFTLAYSAMPMFQLADDVLSVDAAKLNIKRSIGRYDVGGAWKWEADLERHDCLANAWNFVYGGPHGIREYVKSGAGTEVVIKGFAFSDSFETLIIERRLKGLKTFLGNRNLQVTESP